MKQTATATNTVGSTRDPQHNGSDSGSSGRGSVDAKNDLINKQKVILVDALQVAASAKGLSLARWKGKMAAARGDLWAWLEVLCLHGFEQ